MVALRSAGVAFQARSFERLSGTSFWGAGLTPGKYRRSAIRPKADRRTKMAMIASMDTGRGAGCSFGSVSMVQALLDARVVDRDEFCLRQASQVRRDRHAADADDRRKRPEEVQREEGLGVPLRVLQARQDVVADVDE